MTLRYINDGKRFADITGTPLVYWASEKIIDAFHNSPSLEDLAKPRVGLQTSNNERFIRFWHEVAFPKMRFGVASGEETKETGGKWFPHNKGGEYRKWYGNFDYVVDYENDGFNIKAEKAHNLALGLIEKKNSQCWNSEFYFRESLTWSRISSSNFAIRYSPTGAVFDTAGTAIFADTSTLKYLLGLLNTKIVRALLLMLNPTLTFQTGDVAKLPIITKRKKEVIEIVDDTIQCAKDDWDAFETSWDFERNFFVGGNTMGRLIADKYIEWENAAKRRFDKIKANEEELNRIFIDIYGLQDELTPEVADKDVTVRLADRERDVKSLISYLIGVVMGRYSLDVPGLAYAGGDWDGTKYKTYQPDDDGIVPIYRGIGMEDGLTAQIIGLLKLIYGEDTYRQNIDFIAESIGRNNNESSEEALNRYLNDGFFSDHLKIYQKRPIYWLFTSGKNSGFKCLIYMHRYNSDTLARINSRYFLPDSTRLKNELEELAGRLAKAEGRDRVRLEKERQKLAAAYNEAIEYGQVLDHVANQYIEIDLDDGVKDNYTKFQSIEMITDSGNKVKKDLLAPIK